MVDFSKTSRMGEGASHVHRDSHKLAARPHKSGRKVGAAGHNPHEPLPVVASGNPSPAREALGRLTRENHSMSAESTIPATGGAGGQFRNDAHIGIAPGRNPSSDGASGQSSGDTQCLDAAREPSRRKTRGRAITPSEPTFQMPSPSNPGLAGGGLCHELPETHDKCAETAATIATIQALWRRRQQWHSAEKRLTLQMSAICRGACGGDKTATAALLKRIDGGSTTADDMLAEMTIAPLMIARSGLAEHRAAIEKTLAKAVRVLPVYPWAKAVYGLGDLGFASLIGEAGDIGAYRTVSGLWKRMGLAVIGAERQRRKSDAEEALAHGYSPRRRSIMWNIGNGLIGGMGNGPRPFVGEDISAREDWSPYQRLFVERMRYEAERDPEAHMKPPVEKDGVARESFCKHAASRAKRYVEKRFLRELYSAWRAAEVVSSPDGAMPPSNPFPALAEAAE